MIIRFLTKNDVLDHTLVLTQLFLINPLELKQLLYRFVHTFGTEKQVKIFGLEQQVNND